MSYPVSGNESVTPDPSIHTPPSNKGQGLSIAAQIEASAQFIIEGFIGQVLIAFGGINILGVKPFAALSAIGESLIQQANAAYSAATTAQVTATSATTIQSQQTLAKPGYLASDSTADVVFPIANLTGSTASTINVTSAASAVGFINTSDNGRKSSIFWLGQNTSGLTGFYINLYKLNTTTGVATLMEASTNILSSVSNALAYNYYDLVTPINSLVGDYYAVEIVVAGSGTYKIAGEPSDWKPINASVIPSHLGSSRVPLQAEAYGATGSGGSANSGAVSSLSETHTPNAADNYVIAWVASALSGTIAVSYGGTPMTLLGTSLPDNTSSIGDLRAFGLAITPGSGAQTVTATFTGTIPYVAVLQTVSYSGVASVGTVQTTYGSNASASMSQTVTAASGQMVAQAFMNTAHTASGTFSAYNQTQRSLITATDGSTWGIAFIAGDAAGAASVSFTTTASTANHWAAVAIPLLQAQALSTPSFTPTYTGVAPFFGLGGFLFAGPTVGTFTTPGTFTYTVPNWMKYGDFIDVVIAPSGGGGSAGPPYLNGTGGGPGAWVTQTLAYGIDFPASTTSLTLTVGAGGPGSTNSYLPGSVGATSTVAGTGLTTISATGGPAGGMSGAQVAGNTTGIGLGNTTFNGVTYTGGADGNANAPGGGGGGGFPNSPGYAGAPAAIWMTAYQAGTTP